jgi:hypothetical protein
MGDGSRSSGARRLGRSFESRSGRNLTNAHLSPHRPIVLSHLWPTEHKPEHSQPRFHRLDAGVPAAMRSRHRACSPTQPESKPGRLQSSTNQRWNSKTATPPRFQPSRRQTLRNTSCAQRPTRRLAITSHNPDVRANLISWTSSRRAAVRRLTKTCRDTRLTRRPTGLSETESPVVTAVQEALSDQSGEETASHGKRQPNLSRPRATEQKVRLGNTSDRTAG